MYVFFCGTGLHWYYDDNNVFGSACSNKYCFTGFQRVGGQRLFTDQNGAEILKSGCTPVWADLSALFSAISF